MKQRDPLIINIGFACNNKCLFCFQEKREPQFKSMHSIIKELLQAKKNGFSYIIYEGGEPTLRDDIFDLIRLTRYIGFKQIDIQSNGRLFFYKKICENFIKAKVNIFAVSLHAHEAKIHDFLTQTPHSFNQAVQGVRNLKSLNQFVGNQVVLTKINYNHAIEIVSFLADLNIDMIQFNFIQPIGVASKNIKKLVPRISDVISPIKKALDLGRKKNIYIGTMGIPYCLMKNYKDFTQEFKRTMNGCSPHGLPFKTKSENCKNCSMYDMCEGPWSSYVKFFGWEEFKPLK